MSTALVGAVLAVAVPVLADAPATLRAVRQVTTPETTRLIVELSAPAAYRVARVEGRPHLGIPPRVYVDIERTRLADPGVIPAAFPEGPVVRLRATRHGPGAVRLILDVPGLTDAGVFPMLDPFRLVIDARGAPRAAPGAARPAAAMPPTLQAQAQAQVRAPTVAPPATHTRPAAPQATAPAKSQPAPPALPRARRYKIVLDPGHGGKDPGAIGVGGLAEKDVTLAIALRLRQYLAAWPGTEVVLTRDRDVYLALEERTARANAEQADLFISIHANASQNTAAAGVETYYLSNTNDRATLRLAALENGLRSVTGRDTSDSDASLILSALIQNYKIEESVQLADALQDGLVQTLAARGTAPPNLGVKRGPFFVLVGAGMPCALVEVAFLTHPEEGARLAQADYLDGIAEGLLRGIRRFVENSRAAGNI